MPRVQGRRKRKYALKKFFSYWADKSRTAESSSEADESRSVGSSTLNPQSVTTTNPSLTTGKMWDDCATRVPTGIKAAAFELKVHSEPYVPTTEAQTQPQGQLEHQDTALPCAAKENVPPKPLPIKTKRKSSDRVREDFSVYIDVRNSNGTDWGSHMKLLGHCDTAHVFEKRFGKSVHTLRPDLAIRVFRTGIAPAWEDPANSGHGAGRWTIMMPTGAVSKSGFRFVMKSLMDGELPGVNGAITTCKRGLHMLILWTKAVEEEADEQDPYDVQSLVQKLPVACEVSLSAVFKAHQSTPVKPLKARKGLLKKKRVSQKVVEAAATKVPEAVDSDAAPNKDKNAEAKKLADSYHKTLQRCFLSKLKQHKTQKIQQTQTVKKSIFSAWRADSNEKTQEQAQYQKTLQRSFIQGLKHHKTQLGIFAAWRSGAAAVVEPPLSPQLLGSPPASPQLFSMTCG